MPSSLRLETVVKTNILRLPLNNPPLPRPRNLRSYPWLGNCKPSPELVLGRATVGAACYMVRALFRGCDGR